MNSKLPTALLFLTILLMTISVASASVSCNPNSLSVNYEKENTEVRSISCSNSDNSSINILELGSFFTLDKSQVSPSGENISVTFPSSNNVGSYSGGIGFEDGSSNTNVGISAEVTEPNVNTCQLNPSLVSKTQTVQKGASFELPRITFNPQNCGSFDLSASNTVSVDGGIQFASGKEPVYIKEITPDSVLLGVRTENIGIGTWNPKLKVDSDVVTTLQITVTTSSGPTGNFSIKNDLPDCSLSSTTLGTNQSYKMTCNNVNPDVTVKPKTDTTYIVGKNVESDSGTYTWYFKPKKVGTTNISAEFLYLGAPVGQPFSNDVKITPSGQNTNQGVNLAFNFFQKGDKVGKQSLSPGNVTLQVIDNKSGNLKTDSSDILLDGSKLKENKINIDYNETYQLRASSPGYNDRVLDLKINKSGIGIEITPNKEKYLYGERINISTGIEENVSVLVNDQVVVNPSSYKLQSSGNVTIEAVKEGFDSSKKVIKVEERITYASSTPSPKDWSNNQEVVMELSENSSWKVNYEPMKDDGGFGSQQEIASGDGKEIVFETQGDGSYSVEAKKSQVVQTTIESSGFGDWIKQNLWWTILIGLILAGIIYGVFFRQVDNSAPSSVQFNGPPQTSGQ